MKKIILILFIAYSTILSATKYYVSTSGNDANNGLSESTPWRTLYYAEAHATTPGDIIALKKGDTWTISTVLAINSGGAGGVYTIWDGGLWGTGENAVLQSSNPTGYNSIVHIAGCDYLVFQNITIDANHENQYGIAIGGNHEDYGPTLQNDERYISIQNCKVFNVGDGTVYRIGILAQTWNNDMYNISVKNCTVDYTGAHGIAFYMGRFKSPAERSVLHNGYIGYNYVTNAGQAPFAANNIFLNDGIDSCIVEHNTIVQGTGACPGIAIAHSTDDPAHQPRKIHVRYNDVRMTTHEAFVIYYGGDKSVDVYYNLFYCSNLNNGWAVAGIQPESYNGASMNFYNNVLIDDGDNNTFCFKNNSTTSGVTTFRNNILVNTGTNPDKSLFGDYPGNVTSHCNNSFHRTLAGAGTTFLQNGNNYYSRSTISSWESTCINTDPLFTDFGGSNFHLQSGSPLKGKGVIISGITTDFDGNTLNSPPDLGCFAICEISANPVYLSSAVENATPSRLEMTYNLTLANIVPAASAFTVNVNSAVRSVSTVSISGTKVLLTLGSPVVVGDVVTVAYTKPSANQLQTTSGGQAATITAQTVTNRVNPVSPTYVSSAVENATPSRLEMTYNLTLANIVPAASAFTVNVNSAVRSVSTVSISGTKVLLTLGSPVVVGDVVTVAYTKPSANQLQTTSGGQAATITAQTVTNRVNPVSPAYVSSAVENATPSRVEMTYNMTLANIVPAASAFTVNVNSAVRSVSTVSISGTKVLLTLGSPVVVGNVVTVAYTKPSANPLQTTSGGQAATITAQTVTNRVNPVTPAYVSSAVENATPSRLEMTYNLTLANIVPAASAFTVNVNSAVRSVSTVSISGTKVLLTLGSPVVYGDVVTVAYTKPSANQLQTTSGGQAATITAQTVTNRVNPVSPAYVSSAVENATPSRLEMTYNMTLANIVPAASAFTVNVNSAVRSVSTVAISGTKVLLTLGSPVVYGDVVTVAYTKPSANPLQTSSGGQAVTISSQPVTNCCLDQSVPQNQLPVVQIINPKKNSLFTNPATVTIETNAYDPDGSLMKVEFFNGSRKLGERTTKPYIFVWNNVPRGRYTLTAKAYDNSNATKVSNTVHFYVRDTYTFSQAKIEIVEPSQGKEFDMSEMINIAAESYDPDNIIKKVEYFAGLSKIGESNTAPYSISFESSDSGTIDIEVVASDSTDNMVSYAIVTVDILSIDETTGLSKVSPNSDPELLNIYPNPNDGRFMMDLKRSFENETILINIINTAGKTVYTQTLSDGETNLQFDLNHLNSGLYFMVVSGKEINTTKKFIIK